MYKRQHLNGKTFKVWSAKVIDGSDDYEPGCIYHIGKNDMEQIKEQLTDIKSMNMDELTEFIISLGEKKFRAKPIYELSLIHI